VLSTQFRLVTDLGNLLSAVMGAAMPLTADFIRHPRAPEFAAIRSRLAAAYLEHKNDLGESLDNIEIIKRVDEITALLFAGSAKALRTNNQRWLKRYQWFGTLVDDLMDDVPRKPLDG
jgi:hypothetical protein